MHRYIHTTLSCVTRAVSFIRVHKALCAGLFVTGIWCIPYITTGDRVVWGDFTFFAQAYEAMRQSILHYHQFPWWNPWVSGGIPLYANPQMGVFSIQLPLVLLFGAAIGLKLAIIVYTFAGYISMQLLLRRYFKVPQPTATLLALLWIFCSFFVSHLPSHFTFVWYMLAPLYVYLSLTVRGYRSGLVLGLAFAIMALSQIHNPFVHISAICGLIIVARLIHEKRYRIQLCKSLLLAAVTFGIVAGHRSFLTLQNLHQFPRTELVDPAPSFLSALMGPFVPMSLAHPFRFIPYPEVPASPWGYIEVGACLGAFALMAFVLCVWFTGRRIRSNSTAGLLKATKPYRPALLVLALGLLCYLLAYGAFSPIAPYSILKHMPVLGQMRVSTRWFIFFDLAVLVFIGLTIKVASQRDQLRKVIVVLLFVAVGESFVTNFGYQSNIFNRYPVRPAKPAYDYPFVQTSYFGESRKLSDGTTIANDGYMPHEYREYDATLYNQGILYANDSLVQLALDKRRSPGHPTCPVEEGCNFVRSNNATVTYWSPNKIILKRTANGPIYLNANQSSYFVINGKRNDKLMVSEPFTDFAITDNKSRTITISVQPSIISPILHRL